MKTIIRRGRIGEPKVVPVREYQWTEDARTRFLDHLAATCNVKASCAAAGRHPTGAYALRRRDPAFAAQWRAALEAGYDTLEAALLAHAIAPLEVAESAEAGDADADVKSDARPDPAAADFDPVAALALLKHHRAVVGGLRAEAAGGPAPGRASEADTDAAILTALARLDARTRAARGPSAQ